MNVHDPALVAVLAHGATLFAVGILVGALLLGALLGGWAISIATRLAARQPDGLLAAAVRRARGPVSLIAPLVGAEIALPYVDIPHRFEAPIEQLVAIAIIASVAWVVAALIELGTDLTKHHQHLDIEDNLRARQIERLDWGSSAAPR